jgi:AcrR family transcriptional regulator
MRASTLECGGEPEVSDRVPAPPRERRSHAERTAQTCQRIMSAVIESIAEVGYQRTTANEISRRAGLTWGAVQHHFGDKDGILMAVLEASFGRFALALADVPSADLPLADRVALFVDRSWKHFSSPHYRSTFEILLNLPANPELNWQSEMLDSWIALWCQYFPENALHSKKRLELMRYTISVLSGLATTNMLEGQPGADRASETRFLKGTLEREIGE